MSHKYKITIQMTMQMAVNGASCGQIPCRNCEASLLNTVSHMMYKLDTLHSGEDYVFPRCSTLPNFLWVIDNG